jgi:hypothetical protein
VVLVIRLCLPFLCASLQVFKLFAFATEALYTLFGCWYFPPSRLDPSLVGM